MKINQRQEKILVDFVATFLVNWIIFGISILFTEVTFIKSLFYAFINAIWMPFLLLPVLTRIPKYFQRQKLRYQLNPLTEYFKNFSNRQIAIEKEVIELELNEKKLLEKYKYDWKLYRKFLIKNNINYLYHFTDRSNLDSIIKNGGLYSWKYCLNNRIQINNPGGDELSHHLDKRAGLDNYIRLSFTANHPMMYYALKNRSIINPVILKIDAEVIYWLNSKYSDTNAASKNCTIGDNFDLLSIIDIKTIKTVDYFNSPIEKKKFYQAEILVKENIPLKFIKNVYEYNEL